MFTIIVQVFHITGQHRSRCWTRLPLLIYLSTDIKYPRDEDILLNDVPSYTFIDVPSKVVIKTIVLNPCETLQNSYIKLIMMIDVLNSLL